MVLVCTHIKMRGESRMLDNIFWFIIGFILGFFFFIILINIKNLYLKTSKNVKHRKYTKMREDLEK